VNHRVTLLEILAGAEVRANETTSSREAQETFCFHLIKY